MLLSFKKLIFTLAPITVLVTVLVAGLKIVQSNTVAGSRPATRVATQSVVPVVIEAKSGRASDANTLESPAELPVKDTSEADALWIEICLLYTSPSPRD